MTGSQPSHLLESHTPGDPAALAALVRECYASHTAIYPIGGATSLDYGLAARQPGIGLITTGLARVIDYPARDMTITVEAGIRVAELQQVLAIQRQTLPIDVPQSELATLGGIIATDTSGPRRYSHGTLRDYVIGIHAVDGRGIAFKAGGRVVKNVAGYDFCKLLTGSLGTLAVIWQVTLKVKPLPQRTALITAPLADARQAERALDMLSQSQATPAAIELLVNTSAGNALRGDSDRQSAHQRNDNVQHGHSQWHSLQSGTAWATLAIRLEGTEPEVTWMIDTLRDEIKSCGAATNLLADDVSHDLWQQLIEFPARYDANSSCTTLQFNVLPSRTVAMLELIQKVAGPCVLQAHAGSGIIIARLAELAASDVSRVLVSQLQPAAQLFGGRATVLHSPVPGELTRHAVWGPPDDSVMLMNSVKQQFDPHGLLNPGRFVYTNP